MLSVSYAYHTSLDTLNLKAPCTSHSRTLSIGEGRSLIGMIAAQRHSCNVKPSSTPNLQGSNGEVGDQPCGAARACSCPTRDAMISGDQ